MFELRERRLRLRLINSLLMGGEGALPSDSLG